MPLRRLSIVSVISAALFLSSCGSEAAAPEPATPKTSVDAALAQPVMGPERRILAFGDSLFAGYGVDSKDSYPSKLEAALRAKGVNARVANAGVSGDTTSAGLQRLAFTLDAQEVKPDLFILELGGNDLLRGVPPSQTRGHIDAMLTELKKREIPVLLMGMRAPPNLGQFRAEFDGIYPDLAKQYGAELVPFFLESIYTKPELIQGDRVHPTVEGIETLVGATIESVAAAIPDNPE